MNHKHMPNQTCECKATEGQQFLLKGRTGPVFTVTRVHMAAGFIPSVYGIGRRGLQTVSTTARIADVDLI